MQKSIAVYGGQTDSDMIVAVSRLLFDTYEGGAFWRFTIVLDKTDSVAIGAANPNDKLASVDNKVTTRLTSCAPVLYAASASTSAIRAQASKS